MGNIVTFGLLFSLTIALMLIKINPFTHSDKIKMCLNPISYTILNWYKFRYNGTIYFGEMPYTLSYYGGIVVWCICCLIVFIIGAIIVQKKEIISNDE